MIPNSMARFPPPPDTGARPVMWKNLGVVAQNVTGFIEMLYELKTFNGDLDEAGEAEVREAADVLLDAITATGRRIDPDAVYVLQRRQGLLKVRLIGGFWGEPTATSNWRM